MNKLFELHMKMYDVRWNGAEGDLDQLEKEFTTLAKLEKMDLEKTDEMLNQLYIPPYKADALPEHLKPTQHGGKREGSGRPSLGTTKKVSITLNDDTWREIEKTLKKYNTSKSALFREIIEEYYKSDKD